MSYSSEVLADSPLLRWRLGEANGAGTAVDPSGNGRDGTYHYGGSSTHLTLGASGALAGDADTAASFNGSTGDASGVDIAHAAWMDVSAFSLECWVKTTDTGIQPLWDRDPGGGQRPWQFRLNSGKFEFVRICNAAGSIAVATAAGATTVNDGIWHHLVSTYDGSTIKLYVDKVLDNGTGTAAAGGVTLTATDGLRFGWSLGAASAYGVGFADELAYYGTALSAARIAAHYDAATASPTTGSITLSGSAAGKAPASATGSLTLSGTGTASASAGPTAATATASLTLSATAVALPLYLTDTSNALDGLDITFTASTSVERPPAPVPSGLVLAEKYDKAIAYPQPVMDNGRPT